jgi:hypothetical protein
MTRPTRMLLILGLFGVGAVVVLSMMAQRYGKVLQRAEPSRPVAAPATEPPAASPPGKVPGEIPDLALNGSTADGEQALRHVDAFIGIREALSEGPMATRLLAWPDPAFPLSEAEARALDDALGDAGLDRATYREILQAYRAWSSGREDPGGPLPAAFERRRGELRELD